MRMSLLSVIMIACVTLLIIKSIDVIDKRQSFVEEFLIPSLSAQEEEEEGEEEEDEEDEDEDEDEDEEDEDEEDEEEEERIFTKNELDILQRLSKRREKLEEWQRDLEVKDNVLKIAQTKVDQKIEELRTLKNKVEKVLMQYNEKMIW